MRRRTLLPTLALLFPRAACGDDPAGPSAPSIRGTYAGTWTFTLTDIASGQSATGICPGSVTIASQSGSSFSGSFLIQPAPGCEGESGSVSGTVRPDGGVTVSFDVPGGSSNDWEDLFGCVVTSADQFFTGLLAGTTLTVSASANLNCQGFPVRLLARFTGTRAG